MSDRASGLGEIAERQIDDLIALFSRCDARALSLPCREQLGDGSVAARALLVSDCYQRIAKFIDGKPDSAHGSASAASATGLDDLRERLAARRELAS